MLGRERDGQENAMLKRPHQIATAFRPNDGLQTDDHIDRVAKVERYDLRIEPRISFVGPGERAQFKASG